MKISKKRRPARHADTETSFGPTGLYRSRHGSKSHGKTDNLPRATLELEGTTEEVLLALSNLSSNFYTTCGHLESGQCAFYDRRNRKPLGILSDRNSSNPFVVKRLSFLPGDAMA